MKIPYSFLLTNLKHREKKMDTLLFEIVCKILKTL